MLGAMLSHGSCFLNKSSKHISLSCIINIASNVKKAQKKCELKETCQSNRIK